MSNLSSLSVKEATLLTLEILLYGAYEDSKKPQKYGSPFDGTFEDFFTQEFGGHNTYDSETYEDRAMTLKDMDSERGWEYFRWPDGATGSRDGLTAKVVETFGGEGEGDQYWMVISLSDGLTTRYFRKDGYYASYDGGTLDGETQEVRPVERMVTFYE